MATVRVLEPYSDRIIVRANNPEKKSKGGIIIPDTAQEVAREGTVIFSGPSCERTKVGDKVMYGKYSGTETEVNGIECMMMRENDLLCKYYDIAMPADQVNDFWKKHFPKAAGALSESK